MLSKQQLDEYVKILADIRCGTCKNFKFNMCELETKRYFKRGEEGEVKFKDEQQLGCDKYRRNT